MGKSEVPREERLNVLGAWVFDCDRHQIVQETSSGTVTASGRHSALTMPEPPAVYWDGLLTDVPTDT